nr:uncharacterized protein LOC120331803 isoform X2 [Styela clava]
MVTIRSQQCGENVYVRAYVHKSYSNMITRRAVVKFIHGVPSSSCCTCLVGKSGLCSHVIAIFFQLIYIAKNGSALLEQQCTDLPMRWHKHTRKSCILMQPITDILVTSVRRRSVSKNRRIRSRDIAQKVKEIKSCISKEEVELHFMRTMSRNLKMRKSGMYLTLSDRYIVPAIEHDHDYCRRSSTDSNDRSLPNPPYQILNSFASTIPPRQQEIIKYYDVKQRSQEWFKLRQGRFTASICGSLIGIYGNKEMDEAWMMLIPGSMGRKKNFLNFRRGIEHESIARKKFANDAGISCEECGFFSRGVFGASPDGIICNKNYIVEIKTRAAQQDGPLSKVDKTHVIQAQVQMHCANATRCVLVSYHPETKISTYFLLCYDPEFIAILEMVLVAMKSDQPISPHRRWEPSDDLHVKLWEENICIVPNFKSLRSLRSWCTKSATLCLQIKDRKLYFQDIQNMNLVPHPSK